MTQESRPQLTLEDSLFLLHHIAENPLRWEAANIFHQLDKIRRIPLLSDRIEQIDANNTVIHIVTQDDKEKLVEDVGIERFYHKGHYMIPEQVRLNTREDGSFETWLTFRKSDDQWFPLFETLDAGMVEADNAGTNQGVYIFKHGSEDLAEVSVKPELVHAAYHSALEELGRVLEDRKAGQDVTNV